MFLLLTVRHPKVGSDFQWDKFRTHAHTVPGQVPGYELGTGHPMNIRVAPDDWKLV